MLAEGRGATRNDDEAREWILLAANQGHVGAQHELGVRCRRASFSGDAENASESNLEAYMWFWLATAQGHPGSVGELENLTLRLTHEQVFEGNRRAAKFVRYSSVPETLKPNHRPDL
jgi:TPR repeat protein